VEQGEAAEMHAQMGDVEGLGIHAHETAVVGGWARMHADKTVDAEGIHVVVVWEQPGEVAGMEVPGRGMRLTVAVARVNPRLLGSSV
jgi:hypothetical protein